MDAYITKELAVWYDVMEMRYINYIELRFIGFDIRAVVVVSVAVVTFIKTKVAMNNRIKFF